MRLFAGSAAFFFDYFPILLFGAMLFIYDACFILLQNKKAPTMTIPTVAINKI